MASTYRFGFPTPIHFGAGVRQQIPAFLKASGIQRPLLVTDRGVAALPIYKETLALLNSGGAAATGFSEVGGNPVKSQVTAGIAAYRAHQADAIVGLGGGAALDVAKAIAVLVNHPGDLFDYEGASAKPIDREVPPWIAIPTTAGTGSEVGRSSVISDEQTHIKKIIFSPKLLARAIFADPELTLDLPPKMTAATGMDALTHCVESYLSNAFHPICDGIALEGFRLAAKNLARAVKNPRDIEARSMMLLCSIMGGIAFQKDLGLTHSCAHALSTVADLHHGLANGIMIDHALAFNVPSVPERFETLAWTAGVRTNPGGETFLKWLRDLKAEIGIPAKLSGAGVTAAQTERLADIAFQDGCHATNPRACSRADFVKIFQAAT